MISSDFFNTFVNNDDPSIADIENFTTSIIGYITVDNIHEFLLKIYDFIRLSKIPDFFNIFSSKISRKCSSDKLDMMKILFDFLKEKRMLTKEVSNIYIDIIDEYELYDEEIKLLLEEPTLKVKEDDDNEFLRYNLRIGELYMQIYDIQSAYEILTKLSSRIFRLRTPIALLNMYDDLRGKVQLERKNYADASRAYSTIYSKPENEKMKEYSLRKAVISTILSPISYFRTTMLTMFMQDELATKLDVYFFLKLLVGNRFIYFEDRKKFNEIIMKEINHPIQEAIDSVSIQHNIIIISERLSQIVGDSPINVESQLRKMIKNHTIEALIDQPKRVVTFDNDKENDSQDKNLLKFCDKVSEIVNIIQP